MHTSSTHTHTHTDTRTQHAQPTVVELGAKAAPHTHQHTLTHINLFGFSVYKLYAAHVKNIVEVMSVSLSQLWGRRGENSCVLTLSKSNRNGEAAQSTILWAGKLRPPAAKVQSTRSPWQRNNCMAETSEVP